MKHKTLPPILLFLLIFITALPLDAAQRHASITALPAEPETAGLLPASYLIGPGDVLNISVWETESLTRVATVLPDGTISFPLIGEVQAGGRTTAELRQEIKQRVAPYVSDPVVSVEVQQVNSMHIYVIGKVNKPGRFILNANVDVLQALAMAGGLTDWADKDNIKIFRRDQNATRSFTFNYEDVSKGENLQQNIWLKRGDVIVVP
ncbi:MAG: polysaccharide export protein [Deltaproteobacteria bacterium]|nr:polysaccharide export protein [Deltaproteobacteria bacterium]